MAARMPCAEFEEMPGAGHLCWFDDVDHAAATVHRHLLG
jgi:pimeloyl-ACP methyl ester carboxylesterase